MINTYELRKKYRGIREGLKARFDALDWFLMGSGIVLITICFLMKG